MVVGPSATRDEPPIVGFGLLLQGCGSPVGKIIDGRVHDVRTQDPGLEITLDKIGEQVSRPS